MVAVILADDGSHGGMFFRSGGVDGYGRAFDQRRLVGDLQHKFTHWIILTHVIIHRRWQAFADAYKTRVIRRPVRQRNARKRR